MLSDCLSPNGFSILQDIREEGEVDGEMALEITVQLVGNAEDKDTAVAQSSKAPSNNHKQSSSRLSGKGSKKIFANLRDLVKAVTQQQKGHTNSRKASSWKY